MYRWARQCIRHHSEESHKCFTIVRQHASAYALGQHPSTLRRALLDFIADFANWDNSTVPEFLETSRALTAAAHYSLSTPEEAHRHGIEWPDAQNWPEAVRGIESIAKEHSSPLVLDPFAGGGSIPLEALRVGADAFASDLNPVSVLLNKVVLEYIPKYGQRLADEVHKWGEWIQRKAEKELAEFYPKDKDGATPIAYLWARTIQCEGPGCGAEVPLLRTLTLAKRSSDACLEFDIDPVRKHIGLRRAIKPSANSPGTIKGGSATCPICRYTTPATNVRRQLSQHHGGASNARLYAVVLTHPNETGRIYRCPTERDLEAIALAKEKLKTLQELDPEATPNEPLPPERPSPNARGLSPVARIGVRHFGDLFAPRPTLALLVYTRLVKETIQKLYQDDADKAKAVGACLAFAVDKQADFNSSLSRWANHMEKSVATFGRHALPILWDWGEIVPISKATGSFGVAVDWIASAIEQTAKGTSHRAESPTAVMQSSATAHPLADDAAQLLATDPPYYDAVPYADLSDYFYVWMRRMLKDSFPELMQEVLSPKDEEAIWNPSRKIKATGRTKDQAFYEEQMFKAFAEARRVVEPGGIGVVVFAHKSTSGWEAILQALIAAGWIATGSWPIDTEKADRMNAQGTASLASSVHIVCRPRERPNGAVADDDVGDWRDALQELPRRIHEWMPRLAEEGVVGADAIFACLGPALEIFSRYGRVEKASGETVPLKEYLEHVWAAVSREALSMIFEGASTEGFEADSRLTAMWLWTLTASNGDSVDNAERLEGDSGKEDEDSFKTGKTMIRFSLEYDAARKIAQGLGANLEILDHVVEVKGDTARLLSVAERTPYLFGKEQTGLETAQKKKQKDNQFDFFGQLAGHDSEEKRGEVTVSEIGGTTLDRVHQSMLLFATNRGEALRRFLVEMGQDQRFWRLAQALSALYPKNCDEKRWVDGVLARKKGLGL
jgi:adenine-specific DNA methylase